MSRLFVRIWTLLVAGVSTTGLGACLTMGGHGLAASSGSTVPAGPANRAVQKLYVGPGVMQYFLVPQQLTGLVGTEEQQAELDIVARDSARTLRYGLLHLSVVAPTAIKFPADTLLLSTAGRPQALPTARVLYTEPKGSATLSRLEVYLTPDQLKAYLKGPTQTVWIGGPANRRHFEPRKKSLLALQAFAASVFGLAGE